MTELNCVKKCVWMTKNHGTWIMDVTSKRCNKTIVISSLTTLPKASPQLAKIWRTLTHGFYLQLIARFNGVVIENV